MTLPMRMKRRVANGWQRPTSRLRMGSMMSNVIAVCDREADIHAYLQDKLAHNERFVVRSSTHART